jgi:hypothetical protein
MAACFVVGATAGEPEAAVEVGAARAPRAVEERAPVQTDAEIEAVPEGSTIAFLDGQIARVARR